MKVLQKFKATKSNIPFSLSRILSRNSFFNFKPEPIKYETSKTLPYSQENFYSVIKDVDDYQNFIPWINKSKVFTETIDEHYDQGAKHGRYDAETKIGFSALSFTYISHVTYEQPYSVLSESYNTKIFDGLHSHWQINEIDDHVCEIFYKIQMTFTNPIYTQVTNQFFDYLAKNINKSFEKRCYDKYYKNKPIVQKDKAQVKKAFPPPTQLDQIYKEKKILHIPEDFWIWDLHNKDFLKKQKQQQEYQPQNSIQQALIKKDWRKQIIVSLQELKNNGYLKEIDLIKVQRSLESSENLLRESKMLYDAFGQDQNNRQVYARHMQNILKQALQSE